jgi:hypothetical protein
MNIKYTVKDNFLNQADFENIKNSMFGDKFPWYFQDGVSEYKSKAELKSQSVFYWTHMFFNGYPNKGVASSFYPILDALIKKLKVKALIRVKANLYSNQGKIIEHEKHTDLPFKHEGAIFSLNTCNGFTILKDNTKIKSVANRLLLFDPSVPHHSSTCTDAKARWNININFF